MIRNVWVFKEIQRLEKEEFYGSVQINFTKGEVPNIDIKQHKIKPKDSSLKEE